MNKFKELVIGDLKAKLPVVQGGMGIGISLSGLSSAVANQGGIGVIGTAGIGLFETDAYSNYFEANIRALKNEIRKAREKTQGILGVNIMVALSNFADVVKTSIEEKIDIIFSGAGLPLNLPEFLQGSKHTKLVPIVSSGRAASIIMRKWIDKYKYVPDAIVVEGPKAGGHLGFKPDQLDDPNYSLDHILTDVLHTVTPVSEKYAKKIPVIAGGGIYTGSDIRKFIEMGASGVQMGTRFVTTEECDAAEGFKKAYVNAREEDISIIKSPVGLPGRVIRNQFVEQIELGERIPYKCPYHCIVTCDYKNSPYCIALALINAQKGNLNNGFAFAGTNAYQADRIIKVEDLISELTSEYNNS
ncbi:MAG: 2-nitropropane dioxygenase [Clostridiales bacterium 43-6]|nr:MAG: 2-nitropropane dioxygenase [Clostridiales bacterium 43-6]